MADIGLVYDYLQKDLLNKDQRGFLTPDSFNRVMPRALSEWVMKRYNNLNLVQPNKAGWQRNLKVTDDLRFLLVNNKAVNIGADGVLTLPSDYLHLSSIYYKYKWVENGQTKVRTKYVDIVNDNEREAFLGSEIYMPLIEAKKYVIATFYSGYLEVYPANVGQVELTYLRKPVDPVWAFTVSASGRPVYDPANSVDLEAPDDAINEIVMMALSMAGINLREDQVINYAEMNKQQGI